MQSYEYRVVPAPHRGIRARGARGGAERLAAAVADRINALAREGWEYVRADMLPSEERTGLTLKTTTVYHNLLVFRRPVAATEDRPALPAADAAPPAPTLTFPRIRLGAAEPVADDAPRLTPDAPTGKAPQIGPAEAKAAGVTKAVVPD